MNGQQREALEIGNAIRFQRAADKKLIQAGDLDPVAILERPPAHWEAAKLRETVTAIPGIGRSTALRWAVRAGCQLDVRLRDMTERQRHVIVRSIEIWRGDA